MSLFADGRTAQGSSLVQSQVEALVLSSGVYATFTG